ncbi:MAG: carbonic anhydrase [Naasia sp.]|uniref:hypothetical protein n=1 Tax=Naasia sp. TaxID=2546198 RepID=UPI00262D098D|nr:hypothetical protein [Naasia sp.]MCU1571311.1 carbonic anhydrase [Naasia sp.]
MRWGGRAPTGFAKGDDGAGKLGDYRFDLMPNNDRVRIRLAGSDAHQDLLRELAAIEPLETAGGARTPEEERIDAPIVIRVFGGGRIVGPVGTVPRGLEAPVVEALSRLERAGRKPRIPVEIVQTKQGLRVELLLGLTR